MPEPTPQFLKTIRNKSHPNCIACGDGNRSGLGLEFRIIPDNGVEAEFKCSSVYQGYPELLHGGIASLLLDSAMANCLFAHRIEAVTARMIVRYQFPIKIGRHAIVRAWMREYEPPLYVLEAEIKQDGKTAVRGSGKFIKRDV